MNFNNNSSNNTVKSLSLLNIEGACPECEFVETLEQQASVYLHGPTTVDIVDNEQNMRYLATVPTDKLNGITRKDKLQLAGKQISELLLNDSDPLKCYKVNECPLKTPNLLMQKIIGAEAYLGLPSLTYENKRQVIETPVKIKSKSADVVVNEYIESAFSSPKRVPLDKGIVNVTDEDGSVTSFLVRKNSN